MELILSKFSASISELKKNPTALLTQADGEPVTILNRNRPTAYLVPADIYETMLNLLEDYELGQLVRERQAEKKDVVDVNIDEL